MTDLMDRLAQANPARQDERPSIDDVWRKIAAEPAPAGRRRGRRRGAWAVLMAAAAVPVAAVIVIALPGHHAVKHRPEPAVTGGRRSASTIEPAIQRAAQRALGHRAGTVVIMDPRTGAIEAMARAGTVRGGTLVPPGATFDVVTAAAAIDSGRFGPQSRISGASPFGAGAAQVRNDQDQSFGRITLNDALTLSVNTAFARVGVEVGAAALTREIRLFELQASTGASRTTAVGPLAAGQGPLTATPLQLASIAASIANEGRLAQPHLRRLAGPAPERTVMTARTAQLLTQMLRRVVAQGTGTAADLPRLNVAGKTGTAAGDANGAHATVASFIGFAPADHPTMAIAVVISAPHTGFGGTEAAPIAARIIREVLRAHP